MTARARVTYVGHATTLIEVGGARLLTDPALRPRMLGGVIRRVATGPAREVRSGIDAVLVSHLHHDHLDFPSLRSLEPRPRVAIVPAGAGRTLRRRRFDGVVELAPGETTELAGVRITATEAAHNGRRFKLGPAVAAVGYLIETPAAAVYFAGDTDLFEGMGGIAASLDAALLPIGGWGPKLGSGHLDPRKAARAAAMLEPRIAIPIHWGTLLRADLAGGRRGQELLEAPPIRFRAEIEAHAPGVEAVILEPGHSTELARP